MLTEAVWFGSPKVALQLQMLHLLDNNKSLDPLRAKKAFIRKKLGHTAAMAKASGACHSI